MAKPPQAILDKTEQGKARDIVASKLKFTSGREVDRAITTIDIIDNLEENGRNDECGKQVSDKANACPNCGYPIANSPTSTGVKIRCLSDDRSVKYMIFLAEGRELTRAPIGTVATINISKPTRITIRESYILMTSGDNGSFNAIPGKCYEARFCKPGIAFWDTVVSEVSSIV